MTEESGGLAWLGTGSGAVADEDFAEFFAASWPRLFRTALAITGDRDEAEDALQAAYAKAYSRWRRVRSADRPEAYVRKIVVNQVIDSRRHGFRRRERPHETVEPRLAVPSHEADVVGRDALWAAVSALPRRQRAVIVLRYYEDLSEAAIAETLGCSAGTVKSQASAALATLRRSHAPDDTDHIDRTDRSPAGEEDA